MTFNLINQVKPQPYAKLSVAKITEEVCAGGFLCYRDKFLLGKRSKKKDWAPGLWDILGGHSLKNEHPLLTLQRETFEESGVQVINAELITLADVASDKDREPLFRYYIYMITHFKGKAFNNSTEHSKLQWFTRADLGRLPLAIPEYLQLLDEWLTASTP